MKTPKVSVCVPFHWMRNWQFYLVRCLESIEKQSFKDYEVILTKAGSMSVNTNRAMESARGDLVKILYMDDYLAHGDSLKEIAEWFDHPEAYNSHWLVTGCLHQGMERGEPETPHSYHEPKYAKDIHTGNNSIGSPSVLTMRKTSLLYFDERLSWLLDCDLYRQLYDEYGLPTILNTPNVIIGLHDGQTSNLMSNEEQQKELDYMSKKYV